MKISFFAKKIGKAIPVKYCGAVIVAAGNAARMGGIDKVMAPLGSEPVLLHSVRTFQACDTVQEIVVVTRRDLIDTVNELCVPFEKVKAVVAGGADRSSSVEAGLRALSKAVKLAAIHDGARPLITRAVIDRTVRAANTYSAAAPFVPVKDTVKVVHGGLVSATPDRSKLQAVQTPQVFDKDLLCAALQYTRQHQLAVTDDCSAVEQLGMSVKVVEGDEKNLKVTTPMDLKIAQMLLEEMSCE